MEDDPGEKRRIQTKLKMKWKIHHNIMNQLVTEYIYIFAPFCEIIRDTVTCSLLLN